MSVKSQRAYLVSAVVCSVLTVVPFLAVTVPPITDLPQQTAQIRLLSEALSDPESPYRIQWSHPNKLGYLPLILTSAVTKNPLLAARLAMCLLGILWVAAIHLLARDAGRPVAAAAAASIFFFNHVCYWGFLNFLIGLPVFVLWSTKLRRCRAEASWREAPGGLLLATLLYSAHVLWLAAGVTVLFGAAVLGRWGWRAIVLRSLWTLPPLVAVALWYPEFTASGFDSSTAYGPSPFARLHPGWWINSALGGLRGSVESVLLGALIVWLLLGALLSRGKLDRWLALAGGLFLVAALVLPSVQQHTIFFASRWLPVAAVFLTLAIPPPRLRPVLQIGFPLLLVASLSVATTSTWLAFEDEELDGFHQALARLPSDGGRLLSLDFVHHGGRVQGFPYYHLYAYGQALRGVELNRTFANEASSLVVYDDLPRPVPWTDGLDWRARKVRRSDIPHFDFVLIHGDGPTQQIFLQDQRLVPRTDDRRWRLYEVLEAAPPAIPLR